MSSLLLPIFALASVALVCALGDADVARLHAAFADLAPNGALTTLVSLFSFTESFKNNGFCGVALV